MPHPWDETLREFVERADGDGVDLDAQQEQILADLSIIVGGLLLAQASAADPLSSAILAAAR